MISKIGGRKVFMSMLMIAAGVGLDASVGLSENMMTLLMTIISAFVAGNIGEHATGALAKKKQVAPTRSQKVDLSPLEMKLAAVTKNAELQGQMVGQLNNKMDAIISLASQPQQQKGY